MDQTDDFEMKPLTTGLGFQKRQANLKEQMAKSNLAQQSLRRSLPSEPPAEMLQDPRPRSSKEIVNQIHEALKPLNQPMKANSMKLTEILPRDVKDVKNPYRSPAGDEDSIANLNFQITDKQLNESTMGTRRGAHDSLIKPLVAVPVSFSSMILDGAIVFAFSLIFLVSLISITRVDLLSVVHNSQNEFATQLSLIVLYLAVFEMYIIVSRSFYGKTVGEWTFDLQMGDDEQIAKAWYPVLVLWRSFLNLLTGIVFLPLLSLAFGKDLASKFSGLQLYRRNI